MISRALPEYTVFPPLENGGQGVVFLGEHRASHRAVAVKVLSGGPLATRAQRARFEREIETLFRLDHPNIVRTYQSGSIEGRLFYVMQRVDGPPITDFLLSYDLSVRQIVELFLRVCDGLSYAHGCGVIHRDIKPGNILIQDDDGPRHGTPYIVDFGLAKVLADREGAFRTQADSPLGTPAYMSPEQIDGRGRMLDVRSDIYSLGVVMYEVLSYEHFPYRVDVEPEQIRRNILNRTPTPLRAANPAVDTDLSAIVGKCLEKDRALRYRSVDELADDLRRWQRGDAVEARKQHRWYRCCKALRRHRYPIAIAIAMLLLLVAGVTTTTMMWQRAERISEGAQRALQMAAVIKLGSVHRDEGRVVDAINAYHKALEFGDGADSPYVLRQIYEASHRLGELYVIQKQPNEAEPYCQAALAALDKLQDIDPNKIDWIRLRGFAHLLRGRLHLSRDEYERALTEFQKSVAIRRALLDEQPNNKSFASRLAKSLALAGRCHRHLGAKQEAYLCYSDAHTIREELLTAEPDRADYIIDCAASQNNFAAWHITQKTQADSGEARRLLRAARNRLEALLLRKAGKMRAWDINRLLTSISGNLRIVDKRLSVAGT